MTNLQNLHAVGDELFRIAAELKSLTGKRESLGASTCPAGSTSERIRAAIHVRRLREEVFQLGLFADPAWEILLELAALHLEGEMARVTHICVASRVPQSTALRWISKLVSAGLVERNSNPTDKRETRLWLSKSGWARMSGYIEAVTLEGLPIA